MSNTCMFQKYRSWSKRQCTHPKRNDDFLMCKRLMKCSHKEPIRKCEIAKTYFVLNTKSIDLNMIKACPFTDACKRDDCGDYPECDKDFLRDWGNEYKKEFEIEVE